MATRRFAEGTEVAEEKSRADIEKMLRRYGAESFGFSMKNDRATIGFEVVRSVSPVDGVAGVVSRTVRFDLKMPAPDDVRRTQGGRLRTGRDLDNAVEAERRRRWRALHLCIKAKLEAVETGISSFDDEFLAHIVVPVPGGATTLGQWIRPQLEEAYNTGKPIALLPPAAL